MRPSLDKRNAPDACAPVQAHAAQCGSNSKQHALSFERLSSLLKYDPDKGTFVRLISVSNGRGSAGTIAGTLNTRGYNQIRIDGKIYLVSRLAVFYMTGKWPPFQVDHINGVSNDDRWKNLRLATPSQNQANRRVTHNKHGFKGVIYDRRSKRFYATVKFDGRRKSSKYFRSAEEAHFAYQQLAVEMQKEFARIS